MKHEMSPVVVPGDRKYDLSDYITGMNMFFVMAMSSMSLPSGASYAPII